MENVKVNENASKSFEILSKINVSDRIKEKIGLKYLSWADAWGYLKAYYPDAYYVVYDRTITTTETSTSEDGMGGHKTVVLTSENKVPYFTDGKTCFVKVGVVVNGIEYIENLPVMDNKNNSVLLSAITMTAVNKAIQRAFVKACARHGLGLYLYTGEDLPEDKKAVTIDLQGIYAKIKGMNDSDFKSTLDDEEAQKMAEKLRNSLNGLNGSTSSVVLNYISELLSTYKIERVSENPIALQRVTALVDAIMAELNK